MPKMSKHQVPVVPYLYGIMNVATGEYWDGFAGFNSDLAYAHLVKDEWRIMQEWYESAAPYVNTSSLVTVVKFEVSYTVDTTNQRSSTDTNRMSNLMGAIASGCGSDAAKWVCSSINSNPKHNTLFVSFSHWSMGWCLGDAISNLQFETKMYRYRRFDKSCSELMLIADDSLAVQLSMALPSAATTNFMYSWAVIDLNTSPTEDTLNFIASRYYVHRGSPPKKRWIPV